MSDQLEKVKAEAAAFKAKSSRASEDLMRAQKQIGALQDELEQIPALVAELDQLKAANADLSSQLKALQASLEAASKKADADSAKVAAAEQIAAGLRAL